MTVRRLVSYKAVRDQLLGGDGLFYRRDRKLSNQAVGRLDQSEIVHVGILAWWDTRLMLLETVQWAGARAVAVSSLVAANPGRWDVYAVNSTAFPEFDRVGAIEWMKDLTGTPYGWGSIVSASLRHAPFFRWFLRPDLDDSHVDRRPPFCSQAVAMADQIGGGVDPVLNRAARQTTPGDLARSLLYRYRFTLEV